MSKENVVAPDGSDGVAHNSFDVARDVRVEVHLEQFWKKYFQIRVHSIQRCGKARDVALAASSAMTYGASL